MSRLAEIQDLYSYHRWANERVLEAVRPLSEEEFTRTLGSSFPSIRDTLVHLLSADRVWLSRWEGKSPRVMMPAGWAAMGYDGLRARWSEVEELQRRFVDGLTEVRLDEVLAYTTMGGSAQEAPFAQMLRHVVNHASYHRGQVVTMLRQLGFPGASTDLILYYRTRG